MERATKAAWLEGDGDLREADVEDVPRVGMSVRVRGLSAKYSAAVQSQMKLVTEGREQVARIDTAEMERLQFEHGVIDPTFGPAEVAIIQERFGPAFRKVIQKIDELSGIDKAAIEEASVRFPAGGQDPTGDNGSDGATTGDSGSAVPARASA